MAPPDPTIPSGATGPTASVPGDLFDDPFASTGPFAGPPVTWQQLDSADDGRQQALGLGPRHRQLLQSLLDLAAAHGGGLVGLGRGMLARLEAAHLITATERERLSKLLDLLRQGSLASGDALAAALGELRALHATIIGDQRSSLPALAVASVALASVDRPTDDVETHADDVETHEFLLGVADTVGTLAGSFGGPVTMLTTGATCSSIASHTHVTVSYR